MSALPRNSIEDLLHTILWQTAFLLDSCHKQTGFFRYQNRFIMPLFSFFANNVMKFGETSEWGAGCLVFMATHESTGKKGGEFWCAPSGT
jgi:hypothetical protein|mmetsp:Transcript_3973/g.7329  ORF Transcript_3973/g.7329 Transcript_3973/m.7329 type:complete len:90 (+) Transcript_3973:704-973(+)